MSKAINIFNYEAYYLDALEGTLSKELLSELKRFAQAHPELDIDLNLELPQLSKTENSFAHSSILKEVRPTAHINAENIDDALVKQVENLLTEDEEKELVLFLHANPLFQKEAELYQASKITADTSIQFQEKSTLIQSRAIPLWKQPTLRWAAAAVTLIFVLTNLLSQKDPSPSIASNNTTKTTEQKAAETPTQANVLETTAFVESEDAASIKPSRLQIAAPKQKNTTQRAANEAALKIEGQAPLLASLPEQQSQITGETYLIEASLIEEEQASLFDQLAQRFSLPKKPIVEPVDKVELWLANNSAIINQRVAEQFKYEKTKNDSGNVLAWSLRMGPLSLERSKQNKQQPLVPQEDR